MAKKFTDESLSEEDVERAFGFYKLTHVLKTTPRSGWVKWHLSDDVRMESIAEHIYGCCMLAVAVMAQKDLHLDTQKVLAMLALHETEEVLIGDITPYDKEAVSKKELGHRAVTKVFLKEGGKNSEEFLKLIEEFEALKTPEAIFAKNIDKLEAEFQARYYDEYFKQDEVTQENLKQVKIDCNKKGMTQVSEYFIQHDKPFFEDMFLPIVDKILEYDFKDNKNKKQ